MSFVVNLMTNTDELLLANKQPTTVLATTGDFRETVDWLNPVFKISADVTSIGASNYLECQAAGVNRFYHITGVKAITNALYEVSCTADLRKTAYYAILGAQGIVCRQKDLYNMYLPDSAVPISAKKSLNIMKFPNTPFIKGSIDQNRPVIMLVMGGGRFST